MAAEGGGSKTDNRQSDEYSRKTRENIKDDNTETNVFEESVRETLFESSGEADFSIADPEENERRLCGWLNKCGNIGFVKTAKLLWFVFSNETCKLYFYRNPEDLLPLGEIDIKHASFYFDANNHRPGQFEIRSEGKTYCLDAHGLHRMNFWLEELQKKRRLYSLHRKMISSEKISWTLIHQKMGSGLTGQEKKSDEEVVQMRHEHIGDPSVQDLENGSSNNKSRYWSLLNLRSEIRDAVSNIRTQILPTSKLPSPPSPLTVTHAVDGRDDWTVLDRDAELELHTQAPGTSVNSALTSTSAANSPSTKLGGKLATTLKMFKPGKRSQSESAAQAAKEHVSRKTAQQPGCSRCKILQGDLYSLGEDLKATEEELQANREIIKLLQKELDVMSVLMNTSKECEGKNAEEKDIMLQQKDKHVVELQHSLAILQEQKAQLAQQVKFNESELETLRDQVTMFQDMLTVKDDTVVHLTNQIFELENNNIEEKETTSEMPALLIANTKELESLRDSVKAYKRQNDFLTKEIMELNELRQMDEKREKDLLMNYANIDAMYCQTRSKYLVLLNERKPPVRGGEAAVSQEAVAQLLQEALETETDLDSTDTPASRHPFLSSYSMEHDRYGFLTRVSEENEDDILLLKANQLQRQSDEINTRLKNADEATSKHIKWENFMVGQSGKPLVRSPELKTLIRMGVPHEYKEHIWKGCINFYVGQTRDKLGPNYYKKALRERIKTSKSNPAVKQIELDLLRTLPSNRHFDSLDSDGISKLRRVLLSYSVHHPIIGYCQGLNRLAAIALLFLNEEESFWCLEALVEHIIPKDYYTKTLAAAQADQRVLKELVAEKLPKLHAHLEQHDVDLTLYTFNWFLTIFVDNVRPETFLRCWDALLYEGSKVLFRFALGFLKYAEEEVLTLRESHHIYRYMRMLGEKITNVKKITHIAFHELNPFPMRAISSKRAHHLQMVREELRELDLIRQDFQSSHSPDIPETYASDDDPEEIGDNEEAADIRS